MLLNRLTESLDTVEYSYVQQLPIINSAASLAELSVCLSVCLSLSLCLWVYKMFLYDLCTEAL